MHRRRFLASAVAFAATLPLARRAFALGAGGRVDVAELQLSSGTVSRPEAWKRLLFEVIDTTSVDAEPRSVALSPDDPKLFEHPFAVLCGDGALPALSDAARQQLVRYLSYGGFLLIDDASGTLVSDFDTSARRLIADLYPTRPLETLPASHSIYRSFFLLSEPAGRVQLTHVLEGISHVTTHPLVYSRNDISGALDRSADGADRLPCTPGGEEQRRSAIKLAINLVMYALTSNYKQDQAHVDELMREGRLE